MTRSNHPNTYARAGAWLGKACRALLRRERQTVQWLLERGCPHIVAYGLMWIVRITALGALLYISVIIAVFVIAGLLVARVLANADLSPPKPREEWRDGLLGFGLYDEHGWRIDPHDPTNPHES